MATSSVFLARKRFQSLTSYREKMSIRLETCTHECIQAQSVLWKKASRRQGILSKFKVFRDGAWTNAEENTEGAIDFMAYQKAADQPSFLVQTP